MKYLALSLLALPASAQATAPSSLPIILTSTLLAALISAGVSAFVSIKLKDKEYRNDYYKQVIAKRMKVYELLEEQLVLLRPHKFDKDDRSMYLAIFDNKERFVDETRMQYQALNSALWLTEHTHHLLAKLNRLLVQLRSRYDIDEPMELIAAGKEYNYALSQLRIDLEAALRQDLQDMHKVDGFFKARKRLKYRDNSSEIVEAMGQPPQQDPYRGISNNIFFLPGDKD